MSKKKTSARPKIDVERAQRIADEIGKVRCWLTGFHAARNIGTAMVPGVPGEDSLRQAQQFLRELEQ